MRTQREEQSHIQATSQRWGLGSRGDAVGKKRTYVTHLIGQSLEQVDTLLNVPLEREAQKARRTI